MDIEDIYKAIQKCTTKKPNTGSIGEATTTSTISNHAALPNNAKDIYLDKDNPHILMTGATMKLFNTRIPSPLYPIGTTMLTQECHLYTPVTRDRLYSRDVTYLQLIKQYSARDKKIVSNTPYRHGSSPTDIRMWYQYVTIPSTTHLIFVHPYY